MSCGAESALISKITTAPEIPATFIRRLGRDEASRRRRGFEIDLRRYLLLRTNYCSPLEERVDRRPAGPRSLPLKMDKRDALPIASAPLYLLRIGSGAFRFCRYLCCDAARLWCTTPFPATRIASRRRRSGTGRPMSASIAPYRRHEALPVPITRRGRALQTVGGSSHLFDALSAWPVCRVAYSTLRFRGLLAPGSTPRANRLGGGRRRGGNRISLFRGTPRRPSIQRASAPSWNRAGTVWGMRRP